MAIATLLKHEHIQDGHLLNIVVKEPQHIVKAVHLCISHRWHEGAKVTTDTVLSMTKWPVLVDIVAAFETDCLCL